MELDRKNKPVGGKGGEHTSISWWCKELLKTEGMESDFIQSIQEEEKGKAERLLKALEAAGVPPSQKYIFNFPSEEEKLIEKCHELESQDWNLTVRIESAETKSLLLRVLDSDTKGVETGLLSLNKNTRAIVTVIPNKEPIISATLLARKGNATMEMVYGPHHWLTKAPPSDIEIVRCWFVFPHTSVQYSTKDTKKRAMLFKHLTTAIRVGLDMGLREFAETQSSLYAEFQWHDELGYRFFDISRSWVWTGTSP